MLLLIGIIILIATFIKNKEKSSDVKFAFTCILIGIITVIFGIIISLLITPYFHVRYMLPFFGALWLGVSILLSKSYNKKYLFIPVLILILVCSCVGAYTFYDNQITVEQADYGEASMLKGYFNEDCVILSNRYSPHLAINYHLPDNEYYLLNVSDNPLSEEVISKNVITKEISSVISNNDFNGKPIYFVQIKKYDELPLVTENYTLTNVTQLHDFPYLGGETTIYKSRYK